jgi:hypothetical protein
VVAISSNLSTYSIGCKATKKNADTKILGEKKDRTLFCPSQPSPKGEGVDYHPDLSGTGKRVTITKEKTLCR